MKTLIFILALSMFFSDAEAQKKCKQANPCDTIVTNINGKGQELQLIFSRGPKHNHPIIAIWMEDMDGKYIQTLYVSYSMGKGIFAHGQEKEGKWAPGERRRPAALPYWAHKRKVMASDGLFVPDRHTQVPDAYTGATPQKNFVMNTRSDQPVTGPFRLLFEINQAFDYNDYWHNTLFPEDEHYKTSAQPSIIYAVTINPQDPEDVYFMNPIGHGHYSGKDGKLFTNLTTLSSALKITETIKVILKNRK